MNEKLDATFTNGPLPEAAAQSPEQWRVFCAELLDQIASLSKENAELRQQRRAVASLIPVPDEIKQLAALPQEQLFAMCQWDPPFEEMVEQIIKEYEPKAQV